MLNIVNVILPRSKNYAKSAGTAILSKVKPLDVVETGLPTWTPNASETKGRELSQSSSSQSALHDSDLAQRRLRRVGI